MSPRRLLFFFDLLALHGAFAERYAWMYADFVGGVTPGRAGGVAGGRPVFDSVRDAVEAVGANASMIAVPATCAVDAVVEALDGGIEIMTVYTDMIPIHDIVKVLAFARVEHARDAIRECFLA